ncbi:hypothetical protein T06_4061 [Trichinella sp. T6]|nr:hypothetical protein T06_15344 [Trichinella sp. T6]KRX32080.1 hypothetical protein T06_4061 [Trichinella sp. T6]
MHNDNQVCDGKGSKPDIILHYNITKGGVDNLDKMTPTRIGIQRLRSLDRKTSSMECTTAA